MKTIKIIIIAIIFLLLFTSCECEEVVVCHPTKTESVVYNSQDNIIKLNGVWLTNMNMNVVPFQRLQYIGIDQSIGNNSLRITSEREILEVFNPSFNYPFTLTWVNSKEVIFHSNYLTNYYNNSDVYYFVITTAL